jgi:hypothetical protein
VRREIKDAPAITGEVHYVPGIGLVSEELVLFSGTITLMHQRITLKAMVSENGAAARP